MATGDLRGNLERLRMQLLSINYPHPFDVQGLKQGIPAVVLPLLHYGLLGYSRHVARYLSSAGYELYAKSDLRFMESALKFFRQEFNYRCALTIAQIFSRGYAERKVIFIHDVIQMCKRKHKELIKLGREKKTVEKVKLTQINYDVMCGCGPDLSNVKFPLACEDPTALHLHFQKTKPWEHTLRSSEHPLRSSKDGGNDHVEIPALLSSLASPTRSRPTSDNEKHLRNGKGENVQPGESPTREKVSKSKSTKNVTYEEDLSNFRPPATRGLHEEDPGHHELCRRIVDMADRLEARFSTLEAGVSRAKETLQEKLLRLEGRVQKLENVSPSKDKKHENLSSSAEFAKGNFNEQMERCTCTELPELKIFENATCTSRELLPHDINEHTSTCTSVGNSRPKRSHHGLSHCQQLQNIHCEIVTEVPASQPLNCQAIRNTQGGMACKTSRNDPVEVFKYNACGKDYTSRNQGPSTNIQEFIAGVRARFNRTLELLSQEANIPNSAAPSC